MSDPFIGEIRAFANTFVPDGWFPCDGRVVSANQYAALYSLVGNTFGGSQAQHTFAIPNLNGKAIVDVGQAPGGSIQYQWAQTYGSDTVALTQATMPAHTHQLQKKNTNAPTATAKTAAPSASSDLGGLSDAAGVTSYKSGVTTPASINTSLAPTTLAPTGGATPHENRQPFVAMYLAIAYDGVYPVKP